MGLFDFLNKGKKDLGSLGSMGLPSGSLSTGINSSSNLQSVSGIDKIPSLDGMSRTNPFTTPPQRPQQNLNSSMPGQQQNPFETPGPSAFSGTNFNTQNFNSQNQFSSNNSNSTNLSNSYNPEQFYPPNSVHNTLPPNNNNNNINTNNNHNFQRDIQNNPTLNSNNISSNELVMIGKNIEIILSKIDAIRNAIENLDHRLSSFETSQNKQTNQLDYGKW